MIVRGRLTFWEIFYLSLVVRRILPQMAAVLAVSLLVVVLTRRGWTQIPTVPTSDYPSSARRFRYLRPP